MKLIRADHEINTVFDLLGDSENDMTASLGWILAASRHFLAEVLRDITGQKWSNPENAVIQLQTAQAHDGITDIEIVLGSDLAIIVEAKQGTNLPSDAQLKLYANRLTRCGAKKKYLVALTNMTPNHGRIALSERFEEINGIPVLHRSWTQIRKITEAVASRENNANKQWLKCFASYLEEFLQMGTLYSNRTYVVSLGLGNPDGWGISWIDIVEKRQKYFYPMMGGGWPDPPPNYIAFRYHGQLKRISHVESFEIVTDFHAVIPEAPKDCWEGPFYVLSLGPPIRPPQEVRVGPGIQRAMRCWCLIDTLLTSKTITEALAKTKKREAQSQV